MSIPIKPYNILINVRGRSLPCTPQGQPPEAYFGRVGITGVFVYPDTL